MAKIRPGPLLSSASGAIGELVFRQTRQGLVVQQRSDPHPRVTPAGEATKDAFRKAMQIFANLPTGVHPRLANAARINGQTVMQRWVGAYYRMFRYGTWEMNLSDGETPPLHIFTHTIAGGTLTLTTNLDTPGGDYHIALQKTLQGQAVPAPLGIADVPLVTPFTSIFSVPLIDDMGLILFPFQAGNPLSLGNPAAIVGSTP